MILAVASLNALTASMTLFLTAVGLSLTLGLLRVLNLAHGALYLLAGYILWWFVTRNETSFITGAIAAVLVVAMLSVVIEKVLLKWLYSSLDGQVLALYGLLLIITNASIWLWTPQATAPIVPASLKKTVRLDAETVYPVFPLFVAATGLVLAAVVWWTFMRTLLGAKIRAGIEDRVTALQLGINIPRISAGVFVAGSALAAIAGVFGQGINGVRAEYGISILTLALVIIVIGGTGSVIGALIGSFAIGSINAFGAVFFPTYVSFATMGLMVAVLLVKPSGLFPGRRIRDV